MSFHTSAAHLRVDGISKSFATRRVLTDVTFTVASGERLGLIGENGTGKSTLLRIIAGLERADAGEARAILPGGVAPRIGMLHQEPPFALDATVHAAIESAIDPVRQALTELDRSALALGDSPNPEQAAQAYARALDEAERLGAWEIDSRIDIVLAGIGLAGVDRSRVTGTLSGGQRARLSIAWLLLNAPDVLLLDEPSNHLDDDAVEFLRRMLAERRGPVLFASHDRAFLDENATGLLDLDPAPISHSVSATLVQDGSGSGIGVTKFTGNYSDYLEYRAEARRRWELQFRDEQAELDRMRASVQGSHVVGHVDWKPRTESRISKKFYGDRNAKVVSRRVTDARNRLDELERSQIRKPPAELRFAGLEAVSAVSLSESHESLIVASEVAVDQRLAVTSLSARAGERWLITGANGAGKSTLFRVLAGSLTPDSGTVHWGAASVALLTQETSLPDPRDAGMDRTVREAYTDGVGLQRAEEIPLARFGLVAPRDESQPLSALSLGQLRRLELAILLAHPPEVLLLDEPTNHLSLPLVEALEAAIDEYPGAVIVASHDRWLRQRWTGESLHIEPLR